MALLNILQTVPVPPIHIPTGGDPHLRGFYSQRFLDSDGMTPVMPGDGTTGFYYDIQCSTNSSGDLVIPSFTLHTTTDGVDVKTSVFTGQLYISGVPDVVIFGTRSGSGWQIPGSLAIPQSGPNPPMPAFATWDQLDIANQGVSLINALNTTLTTEQIITLIKSIPQGPSGWSGFSGSVGTSGLSGYSGYSAISGYSGYTGRSGYSGWSGFSGATGPQGTSGFSGFSGPSGYSGFSGPSGYSGFSGSGVSGYSGFSGKSGVSGYSGYSAYSGYSGYSGFSGP